jgi:hypothetical protein
VSGDMSFHGIRKFIDILIRHGGPCFLRLLNSQAARENPGQQHHPNTTLDANWQSSVPRRIVRARSFRMRGRIYSAPTKSRYTRTEITVVPIIAGRFRKREQNPRQCNGSDRSAHRQSTLEASIAIAGKTLGARELQWGNALKQDCWAEAQK